MRLRTLIPAALLLLPFASEAQQTGGVRAILPPRNPIPSEAVTADSTHFSFIVYGDTRGRRDGQEVQYEHSLIMDDMLRAIAARRNRPDAVRFVLQTGDAVVNGRDSTQWNESFTEIVNRLTDEAGLPYFLAPGNHDVTGSRDLNSPQRQLGLANFMQATQHLGQGHASDRQLEGYPTFVFGYGNTFVLALDSNIAGDSVQFAWTTAQLEGVDRDRYRHIVAFFHNPVFSSGPHGGTTVEPATAVLRELWMPLFRRHGVTMIFTGHEHLYEHWTERYRDAGGNWRRLDQFVTGGGGAPLYRFQGLPDLRQYVAAGAADSVRMEQVVRPGPDPGDNPYHYMIVTVAGDDVAVEVRSVDWGQPFQPYRSSGIRLERPSVR
jgi:hypothetical protein